MTDENEKRGGDLAIRTGDTIITTAELERLVEQRARVLAKQMAQEMVASREEAITPSEMKSLLHRWTMAQETSAKALKDQTRILELLSGNRFHGGGG